MSPFFQKQFIDIITNSTDEISVAIQSLQIGSNPILFLLLSFLTVLTSMSLSGLTNYLGAKESLHMQQLLANRLYDKTLSLRSDTLHGRATGEIVSVYAIDVPGSTTFLEQSLPMGASILFPLLLAPASLILFFSVPALPCFILLFVIISVNLAMAFRQSIFFFRFKKMAADRIGVVNEWIQNIRALRILGWVTAFEKKIKELRVIETQNRIAMVTNGQTMNAISSSVTFFINTALVAYIVYFIPDKVTPGTLLALFWIVAIFLTRPFRQLPWFFTFLFDSWTSLKRVSEILSLENYESHQHPATSEIKITKQSKTAIDVQRLNLTIGKKTLLKDIDLQIAEGEFIALAGEVGSGKSLLLLSLMGETRAAVSKYEIFGNNTLKMSYDDLRALFSYVPQEGFIISGTLRDNIGFEYESLADDKAVSSSLQSAQFDLNIDRMEAGLETEIGERGVNLSGGQKQRLSLARIDFNPCPIILLDDCLSAVDVDTEKKLLNELILKKWKKQTRILATHRLSALKHADRVLFMQEGKLHAQGSFTELLKSSAAFRDFVSSVLQEKRGENVIL